jgi:hypothetical protein
MDETLLNSLRQDPSPDFADRLRVSLREQERSTSATSRWPLKALAASCVAVAPIVVLLSVPSVRASAQSFLALFRVVNFVAVPVDDARLDVLESKQLDPAHLVGDRLEILEDPGVPTAAVSPEQAGAMAGFGVRVPGYLPTSVVMVGIEVKGQQHMRVTADAGRLRDVMNALGITDLEVPDRLDGEVVDVRIPPVVSIRYDRGGAQAARFLQAQSPEVLMPDGIDLSALGEIGLRILGLPPIEAREFANAIDWQTTLLVPLPSAVSSFKQVTIDGQPGVAVERTRTLPSGVRQRTNTLLWSGGGRVYVIEGALGADDILRMAESLSD